MSKASPTPNHAVFLIHGIRTQAEWQQRVAKVLQEDPDIRVVPTRYEFLDVIRFLLPVYSLRQKPVERIAALMRHEIGRPSISKISVVAHSFGTYIVSKILENHADIKFHRLVLCGAIIKDDFKWQLYTDRLAPDEDIASPVINDCGTKDVWPVFAKTITWGYGSSGRFGFGHPLVTDRFHNAKHGDFFTASFARKFWKPFFTHGSIKNGIIDRKQNPWWLSLITVFKIRSLIVAGLIALLSYNFWFLALAALTPDAEAPIIVTAPSTTGKTLFILSNDPSSVGSDTHGHLRRGIVTQLQESGFDNSALDIGLREIEETDWPSAGPTVDTEVLRTLGEHLKALGLIKLNSQRRGAVTDVDMESLFLVIPAIGEFKLAPKYIDDPNIDIRKLHQQIGESWGHYTALALALFEVRRGMATGDKEAYARARQYIKRRTAVLGSDDLQVKADFEEVEAVIDDVLGIRE